MFNAIWHLYFSQWENMQCIHQELFDYWFYVLHTKKYTTFFKYIGKFYSLSVDSKYIVNFINKMFTDFLLKCIQSLND